jgi:hypothetical protein
MNIALNVEVGEARGEAMALNAPAAKWSRAANAPRRAAERSDIELKLECLKVAHMFAPQAFADRKFAIARQVHDWVTKARPGRATARKRAGPPAASRLDQWRALGQQIGARILRNRAAAAAGRSTAPSCPSQTSAQEERIAG